MPPLEGGEGIAISEGAGAGADADAGLRRHFVRNYVAHTVEGGVFIGALGFVNASTLLPTMISGLDGPTWLVSLIPVMMMFGFMMPPIFTAHLIDRLSRYMPLLRVTGVFQRLPYLVAATEEGY